MWFDFMSDSPIGSAEMYLLHLFIGSKQFDLKFIQLFQTKDIC